MAIKGGSNVGLRSVPFLLHPASDAFGRLRVGTPQTLFDSKLIHDKSPLFWDEATVSGAGMSSTYLTGEAAVEIESTTDTAGHFVRQTYMRFNYQPGKSQRIFLTGVLNSEGGAGTTSRIGYFDENNGVFFQLENGTDFSVGIRSNASGSPVDTVISQASMNGDQIPDSNGIDLRDLNIDWTKTQIFAVSFGCLGVGSVVFSTFQDATEYIIHVNNHANNLDEVYMSTPNLPIRYELIAGATSTASKLKCICSTVISEGGTEDTGILRYASTEGTQVDANVSGTIYAMFGLRLNPTRIDTTINFMSKSLLSPAADDFEWLLILNPTVAGTFTYVDEVNSSVQIAKGDTTNTVTGGTYLTGGWVSARSISADILSNSIRPGSSIDGTPDEFVLCVRPIGTQADIQGSLTWRELL